MGSSKSSFLKLKCWKCLCSMYQTHRKFITIKNCPWLNGTFTITNVTFSITHFPFLLFYIAGKHSSKIQNYLDSFLFTTFYSCCVAGCPASVENLLQYLVFHAVLTEWAQKRSSFNLVFLLLLPRLARDTLSKVHKS